MGYTRKRCREILFLGGERIGPANLTISLGSHFPWSKTHAWARVSSIGLKRGATRDGEVGDRRFRELMRAGEARR